MDVNGTRFHLLFGERDWRPLLGLLSDRSLAWDAERTAVALAPRLLLFGRRPSETPPALADRRGAARDRFGTVYWIGPGGDEILYQPSPADPAGRFWSTADLARGCDEPEPAGDFQPCAVPPPPALPRLRGLAVTGHHYLVAGTTEPAAPGGLLIFDLHAGGPPLQLAWPAVPAGVPFAPFDLAPAPGNGLWVLSGDPGAGESRLWRLDRLFRVRAAGDAHPLFAPESLFKDERDQEDTNSCPLGPSSPLRPFPTGVEVPSWAISVAGLPDGSVLLLESDPALGFSRLLRLREGRLPAEEISLAGALAGVLDEDAPAADADLRGHDIAFLPLDAEPGAVRGELYVAADDGNQTFAFRFASDADVTSLDLLPRYLPMRRWSYKALLDGGGEGEGEGGGEVLYDLETRWIPLVEQPRRRYAPEGVLTTPVFDARQPGCVWHRLLLDAAVPPGDGIEVESRAADDPRLLAESDWRREPDPRLRAGGSELPFHRPFASAEHCAGTWELLLQEAAGRYLELRLTLRGSGRTTPRLQSLRVYAPRFSYLREYLPDVYRDEPVSGSFLDRFLANPEGLFTAIEGRIERSEMLFDVRTAPPELLEWLAGWLGAVLDPQWDDARRRLFIAWAVRLFRWRGTPAGLIAAIRLAIDPCPDESIFSGLGSGAATDQVPGRGAVRIVESFLTRQVPGVVLGDPTEPEGPGFAATGEAWEPAHGAEPLHRRFRDFLRSRYEDPHPGEGESDAEAAALERLNTAWGTSHLSFASIRLSPVVPASPAAAADQLAFTRTALGFAWAPVTAADAPLYRAFLARRYGRVSALGDAWALPVSSHPGSFAEIALPDALPDGGAALADWIRFVALVLPIHRDAHRFTVLVPTEPGEGLAERARRSDRVREIVSREKPAHTDFEVKLFWALFQVGTARLGLDTALGEGSRWVALVLGSGFLGASYLAASHPWNVRDRLVAGRDRIPPNQGEPHVHV